MLMADYLAKYHSHHARITKPTTTKIYLLSDNETIFITLPLKLYLFSSAADLIAYLHLQNLYALGFGCTLIVAQVANGLLQSTVCLLMLAILWWQECLWSPLVMQEVPHQ